MFCIIAFESIIELHNSVHNYFCFSINSLQQHRLSTRLYKNISNLFLVILFILFLTFKLFGHNTSSFNDDTNLTCISNNLILEGHIFQDKNILEEFFFSE